MKEEKEVQQVEEVLEEEPVVEEVELTEEEKAELAKKRKKAALTSFIVALVGLFLGWLFLDIVGIVLGAVAIGQAKKAKGELQGASKIFRIVGLIVGILVLVFSIIGLILNILAIVFMTLDFVLAVIFVIVYVILTATGVLSSLALL